MKKAKRQPKRKAKGGSGWTGRASFGFAVLAVLLAAGYLVQVNAVSGKSETIRELETEIAELKETKDKLELRVATDRSMRVVEERVRELGMVPATEIEYVTKTAPVVAKR